MKIHNYLIDCSRFDWPNLLTAWHWLLPSHFTTWLLNRFGDLFLVAEDGRVWRLRLDDGSFECLAESKNDFCDKTDDPEIANDWFMIPLADRLVNQGKMLKEGQCYAFIQLPILGGGYVVENIVVRDIAFQYAALGPIFEKLKDVPDGTKVEFTIKE